jgi:hypothetical protein
MMKMSMLLKAKTRLIFSNNWLDNIKFKAHTDYDLAGNVDAIAIKSQSGSVYDFYRNDPLELPKNFKFTALYHKIKEVKSLVDYYEFETTRIRIHKQDPKQVIPLHVDGNNIAAKSKEDYRLRLITALTEDKDFIYRFRINGAVSIFSLKQGESILFDPDLVEHSMENNSEVFTRFALVQIFKAYPISAWLKDFLYNKKDVIINEY